MLWVLRAKIALQLEFDRDTHKGFACARIELGFSPNITEQPATGCHRWQLELRCERHQHSRSVLWRWLWTNFSLVFGLRNNAFDDRTIGLLNNFLGDGLDLGNCSWYLSNDLPREKAAADNPTKQQANNKTANINILHSMIPLRTHRPTGNGSLAFKSNCFPYGFSKRRARAPGCSRRQRETG